MNPSTDLRLATMIRAMSDVVIPALAETPGLACEQAQLVLGHLHVLRGQIDHAERYERLEHRSASALGAALVAATPGGHPGRERLEAALAIEPGDGDPARLRDAAEAIRAAAEELVERADDDAAAGARLRAVVIEHERTTAIDSRTWFAAMGWESGESGLGSIEEMLTDRLPAAANEASA